MTTSLLFWSIFTEHYGLLQFCIFHGWWRRMSDYRLQNTVRSILWTSLTVPLLLHACWNRRHWWNILLFVLRKQRECALGRRGEDTQSLWGLQPTWSWRWS